MMLKTNAMKKIASIKARHRNLERKIEMEMKRPSPDASIVSTLKKQKLLAKDMLFIVQRKFREKLKGSAPVNA
ncbi:MAG: hypothetical protein DHS20C05_08540 [Hyphococcus sp.]|nr:MAG: hypothetical protein DHS20C05_08540 [Marinicaulis sp.]